MGHGSGHDEEAPPLTAASALWKVEEIHPGAAPGIEHNELVSRTSTIVPGSVTCTDFSPDRVQVEPVCDVADFVARHRPAWSAVRWINIDGLSDMNAIRALAEKYNLHPLAVEDVIQAPQRPKVEDYPGNGSQPARLFAIARMLTVVEGHLRRAGELFPGAAHAADVSGDRGGRVEPHPPADQHGRLAAAAK